MNALKQTDVLKKINTLENLMWHRGISLVTELYMKPNKITIGIIHKILMHMFSIAFTSKHLC